MSSSPPTPAAANDRPRSQACPQCADRWLRLPTLTAIGFHDTITGRGPQLLHGALDGRRKKSAANTEDAIRERAATGVGMLKVARELGVGTSVVQRIKAEMATAA